MDLAERVTQALVALDAQQARIEALRTNLEKAIGEIEALAGNSSIPQAKPNGQGNLHGTRERICANPTCARKFLPRNGRQIYHSKACSRAVWERKQRERQVGEKAADAAGPCTG
jgi:hypothetical protein